ncbi:hypothetical protein VNO77_04401 [Canavalia gladiata]|uniref:Uncharacterized protein n=1 Tax=Canavalia gladiata TaxID=3824 RepID=A0AAN9MYI0_CANGL
MKFRASAYAIDLVLCLSGMKSRARISVVVNLDKETAAKIGLKLDDVGDLALGPPSKPIYNEDSDLYRAYVINMLIKHQSPGTTS